MLAPHRLLHIDSSAGISAGVGMFLLSSWLAEWYRVSISLVLAVAAANLAYGLYSGSLVWRGRCSALQLRILVGANALWPLVCIAIIAAIYPQASVFGYLHFLAEGSFVGALAWLEWRHRQLLITPSSAECSRG